MRGLGFVRKSLLVGFRAVEIDSLNSLKYEKGERSQRKRRIGGNARTDLPAGGGRDAVMIVSIFSAIWEGKKEREIWKGLSGKSSLLQR
jgi:hypothetical protein